MSELSECCLLCGMLCAVCRWLSAVLDLLLQCCCHSLTESQSFPQPALVYTSLPLLFCAYCCCMLCFVCVCVCVCVRGYGCCCSVSVASRSQRIRVVAWRRRLRLHSLSIAVTVQQYGHE